jgi:hypothetical protein
MSQPSVAFVIPHPYVDALACFREPIGYLADAGWHVDLFTTLSPMHPAPFFGRESVRLVPLEMSRGGALTLVKQLVTRRPKYRAIVTVPQWGLHYCAIAARLGGIVLGCISDELRIEGEARSDAERRWKERERRAHAQCAWTMALSTDRADLVRRENRLPDDHPIFVVPNVGRGPARRTRSCYFQDALGLEADARILLHAGSLWWTRAAELAERAAGWTNDLTVVFQTRFVPSSNGHRDSARVRYAPGVLPSALLDYAVSSASIGLALYDSSNANNRTMGTASGKVGLYMKNLLPVIATHDGGFEWLEREGCGVCVDGPDDIPAAAARIWDGYADYCRRVEAYFNGSMSFEPRFKPVADMLARA